MKKSAVIFVVLNAAAMLCFLAFVANARELALAEERDTYEFGDSVNFLLFVAPLLLLCVMANLWWAGKALWALIKRQSFRPALAVLRLTAVWAIAIFISRELARLPPHLTQ